MSNQFTPENSALVLIDYQVGNQEQFLRSVAPERSHARQGREGIWHAHRPHYKPGGSYSRAARPRAGARIA